LGWMVKLTHGEPFMYRSSSMIFRSSSIFYYPTGWSWRSFSTSESLVKDF
jgi:hypothetical protein